MVGDETVRLAYQAVGGGAAVTPAMNSCRSKGSVTHREVLGETLPGPQNDRREATLRAACGNHTRERLMARVSKAVKAPPPPRTTHSPGEMSIATPHGSYQVGLGNLEGVSEEGYKRA